MLRSSLYIVLIFRAEGLPPLNIGRTNFWPCAPGLVLGLTSVFRPTWKGGSVCGLIWRCAWIDDAIFPWHVRRLYVDQEEVPAGNDNDEVCACKLANDNHVHAQSSKFLCDLEEEIEIHETQRYGCINWLTFECDITSCRSRIQWYFFVTCFQIIPSCAADKSVCITGDGRTCRRLRNGIRSTCPMRLNHTASISHNHATTPMCQTPMCHKHASQPCYHHTSQPIKGYLHISYYHYTYSKKKQQLIHMMCFSSQSPFGGWKDYAYDNHFVHAGFVEGALSTMRYWSLSKTYQ